MSQQLFKSASSNGSKIEPMAQPWYLIKTKPRAEQLVQAALGQYEIKVYSPELLTRPAGRAALKSTALFPGYVFFQLEYESRYWPFVRWAPGVSYILNDESGPVVLPAELVSEIMAREEQRRRYTLENRGLSFVPNEPVQIVAGPLAGLEAIFERPLSSSDRVQILIQIVGRITRVTIEAKSLERSRA